MREIQDTFKSPIGHFNASAESKLRYYSHRNSRGRDSEMDVDTFWYDIVAYEKTPIRDAAQSMYRLRKLEADAKGRKQTIVPPLATT